MTSGVRRSSGRHHGPRHRAGLRDRRTLGDLVNTHATALDRARDQIRPSLRRLAESCAVRAADVSALLAPIHDTTDLTTVAPRADVVTEAIIEDRQAQQELFTTLDAHRKPDALVAGHISGLDVITLMQDGTASRLSHMVIHHAFLPGLEHEAEPLRVDPPADRHGKCRRRVPECRATHQIPQITGLGAEARRSEPRPNRGSLS